MRHTSSLLIAAIFTAAIGTAGCTAPLTGDTYSRDEARSAQTVDMGSITSIRTVNLEGTDSYVGKIGGAVVGGVLGSEIDHRNSAWSVLGGTVGALGGAVLGTKAEDYLTRKQALEITVKLDSGTTKSIVQEPGSDHFQIGDRVRILTMRNGTARVSH